MSGYNFTIDELCASATAKANKINNEPSAQVISHLWQLITSCLQPIRDIHGKPILVTSGYRCAALNSKVGGSKTSQHVTGEAADIVGKNNTIAELKSMLKAAIDCASYDQLILERHGAHRWIHISHRASGNQRGEVLYYDGAKYVKYNAQQLLTDFDGLV